MAANRGGIGGRRPVGRPAKGSYEGRERTARRPRESEPGRIYRGPAPPDHVDAPLDTRGIVDPKRYEAGRFESEDSRERADGTQGTIASMRAMFKEYARDMEMKQAIVLKEI
jgi:hypothetical protein